MGTAFGPATINDIEELIDLRLAYLADDFGELSDVQRTQIASTLPAYLRTHLGTDLSIHVARDGHIISCAWLLQVQKPPSPRFPHGRTGILFNVFTVEERRHQGLASAVMHRLLDEARMLELDVVELNATEDGYPLYCSLGFVDDSSTHRPMRMELEPPNDQPRASGGREI